ncbi:MAG TPA: ferrous iron transporter B, partial [Halanaerobiales bacterium]|nr:ferrous iron transporter B [Halanaerobiales bacterium]
MELTTNQSNQLLYIFRMVDNAISDTDKERFRDQLVKDIYLTAEEITMKCVSKGKGKTDWGEKVDDILTSKWLGFPIILLMLGGVFWLTIAGANVPSEMLAEGLFWLEARITDFFIWARAPEWLHGILVLGVYRTMAWVVSVMLPPMAIFFPLFTLMEDLGYLPRVAFNLDNFFKKAGANG